MSGSPGPLPTSGPAGRRQSIWRNRDFRLVFAGQALSELGSGVSSLAYPLLMLALTGSPAQAGLLSAVRAVPYVLFGLLAGVLADRWDRRRIMVGCDAARALIMVSVPVALWVGHLSLLQLYVTGFLGGTFYVFLSAAESGALPNVVGEQDLTAAISAQQGAGSVGSVIAPPLGGALFSTFRGLPFLADGISFAVSAAAVAAVRAPFHHPDHQVRTTNLRSDAAQGLRWLWGHPAIRALALTAAALQVAISGVSLVVIVSVQAQHASPTATGFVLAAVGLGGFLGALLTPKVKHLLGFGTMLLGVVWVQAALWVLFALSPNLIVTATVLTLFAATMPMFGIASHSYLLSTIPDDLRGRVITSFGLLTWTATPIGAATAGLLLASTTPANTSWCLATWVMILAIFTTRRQTFKRIA